MSHRAQTGLCLFGEAGENHGDMIAGVLVASAGNHDTGAVNPVVIARRLQGERHFRPRRKCRGAAKFDAVFVDDDGTGRENQTRLPRFDRDVLLEGTGFNFSSAHTGS